MKKYILYPSQVLSKNDGQLHYVDAHRLAILYGVDMRECIIVNQGNPEKYAGCDLSKFIGLRPMHNGNYDLPE